MEKGYFHGRFSVSASSAFVSSIPWHLIAAVAMHDSDSSLGANPQELHSSYCNDPIHNCLSTTHSCNHVQERAIETIHAWKLSL